MKKDDLAEPLPLTPFVNLGILKPRARKKLGRT